MANVFINGLKSRTGGGKSNLYNYLALLKESRTGNKFFVLTPDKNEYSKFSCEFIEIIDINNLFKHNILFPFLYHLTIPRLLKRYNIDVIFNLGDIVIPTNLSQLYLFDWAYALYPNSIVWRRMDFKDYLTRKIKMFVIRKYINKAAIVIAQIKTMQDRLMSIYGLRNVELVPNALSVEHISGGQPYDFRFPKDKIKLLYLSNYSSHKNFEVLVSLARKIKDQGLPYCIIITIEPADHKLAKRFISSIKKSEMDSIIMNIGRVAMDHVPDLYHQCDALLMPTLLESYGNPYAEAMYHNKTIITSDLDFAKDVCGDAAFYFDPLDENSILASIKQAFSDNQRRSAKIEEGKRRISQLLTREQVFRRYNELLERVSEKRSLN
jgi:glycosyltransferase involved in cell wall biosynthesis